MVPPPGIEPGSSPYESDASPQCFKGIKKIDKRPTSPSGDAAGLFWMFTMSNNPAPCGAKSTQRAHDPRARITKDAYTFGSRVQKFFEVWS